ncbi:hypothetical protein JNUCC0626_20035 [Lentzea sp. JNUCC 0626]|uniref:hypothetical protein n=1 Tax=Lentzea sp. JNUCC 0626 TaxID=3367513 RepID=UPI003748ADD8
MIMFTSSITVLRAPLLVDRYNSERPDWKQATRTRVTGVSVQPTATTETTTEPRDQVVTGWRVYSRAGVDLDVRHTDRVELENGTVCEVVGEIARWPHPIRPGLVHHVEFDIQRVRG